ncbi:alginate lyase family protein [Cerasicoccus maritimus]|uniref:alginate lyase family protein n=1 Tax=Cerasicoccus maritimus TaxID=490089 RepID=UPI002852A9A2|nr:alginate lyase family protein [Cerasicoccus maritimus]
MQTPWISCFVAVAGLFFVVGCNNTQKASTVPDMSEHSEAQYGPSTDAIPNTTIWQGEWLAEMQANYRENPDMKSPEVEELIRLAEEALNRQPATIVNKTSLPASGDRHDYSSMGPYWWPNPNTDDGKPYIRKDGQFNKDNFKDMESMGAVLNAVRRLSLAYYITDDERYSECAALWLRTFFLNESTRMNPHLRYAQAIPGLCEGRSIGMIDTWSLPTMLDAVVLIQGSAHWTDEDNAALQLWVSELLDWFLTSDFAAEESAQKNNHGVWYFAQIGAYGVFSGRGDEIRGIYAEKAPSLTQQIQPDGSMPVELERTRPLHYSTFCLQAYLNILAVSDKLGMAFPEQDKSIHRAVAYLGYYMDHPEEWPYSELKENDGKDLWGVFRRAGKRFDDPRCRLWELEAPKPKKKDTYIRLVFAPVPE